MRLLNGVILGGLNPFNSGQDSNAECEVVLARRNLGLNPFNSGQDSNKRDGGREGADSVSIPLIQGRILTRHMPPIRSTHVASQSL